MSSQDREKSLEEARQVWRAAKTAALSVLDFETGGPLGAFVNVALTKSFQPTILTSTLSRHTQCMDRDCRASLMVTGDLPKEGDALTVFRATLTGRMVRSVDTSVKAGYLKTHPYAEIYAGFGDFGFWIMETEKLYIVAGFGRVYNYDARDLTLTSS